MKGLINYLNQYNQIFSISLPKKLGILLFVAFFANHLNGEESFPFNEDYEFPLMYILFSLVVGILQILITDLNFIRYKHQHFKQKVTKSAVFNFGATTLLYHILIYLPICIFFNWFIGETVELYELILGVTITIALGIMALVGFYAKDIYNLVNPPTLSDKLSVKNGAKTILVPPPAIAYFYSKHKIVYLVKASNESMATNFTLNQLETQLDAILFFRANRQYLLHTQSIHQVENIENGKLSIQLIPENAQKDSEQIIISRYKKQAFLDWFEKKH